MKNGKSTPASFIDNGSILFELVKARNSMPVYLEYDSITGKHRFLESVTFNEITYAPPQTALVANGTIKLPTEPREYGEPLTLFEDIRHFIYKYVDVTDRFLTISALYVMLSWVYDCFDVIPYLRLKGEFGTGKSRFLIVVGSICYKACFAGGATTVSPIFRIIEMFKGVTLIFDEADFRFSGADQEIIKILNCGYMKGMPVLRTEGDGNNRTPTSFDVFSPKIIATRRDFEDRALESRCLTQVMAGKPRKDIPRHLPKTFEQEAEELRNKLLLFRLRNYGKIEVDLSLEDYSLDARINQVALPILSIIDDEKIRAEVYEHLRELQKSLNNQKSDQDAALIVQSAIELVKTHKPLTFGGLVSKINEMSGFTNFDKPLISASKIGRTNKDSLGLITREINGLNQFTPSIENLNKLTQLGKQYHLKVDDVDLSSLFQWWETA